MIELLAFGAVAGVLLSGYASARRFVRRRLRYVDRVQAAHAPWIAGAAAAVVAAPIAWILPFAGIGAALGFGAAVGIGVALGARDVRRAALWQIEA